MFSGNIEYLLEFNVDLDAKNIYKFDAITIACMKREGMILKKILEKMNDFQPKNHSHLLTLVIKKSYFFPISSCLLNNKQ